MSDIVFNEIDLQYIYKTLEYNSLNETEMKKKDKQFLKQYSRVEELIGNKSNSYSEKYENDNNIEKTLGWKVAWAVIRNNTVIYVKGKIYKIDKEYNVEDISNMFPFFNDIYSELEEKRILDEKVIDKYFEDYDINLRLDDIIANCIKVNKLYIEKDKYRILGELEEVGVSPNKVYIDFSNTGLLFPEDSIKKCYKINLKI